jgi:hypothetical protein
MLAAGEVFENPRTGARLEVPEFVEGYTEVLASGCGMAS